MNKCKPNEPCPCSSGKKFKKCCWLKEVGTPVDTLLKPNGHLKCFDGHFWVVKDGEIIDPHFQDYDIIKSINGCVGDAIYCPAPKSVQDEFINALKKCYTKEFGSIPEFVEFYKKNGFRQRANQCDKISLINWIENGGEIVFGSMGWKKRNSDEVWWEFGGENWTTTKKFLK